MPDMNPYTATGIAWLDHHGLWGCILIRSDNTIIDPKGDIFWECDPALCQNSFCHGFIHRHRRRKNAAMGIGNSHQIKHALHIAIFTQLPVKRVKCPHRV